MGIRRKATDSRSYESTRALPVEAAVSPGVARPMSPRARVPVTPKAIAENSAIQASIHITLS